MKVEINQTINPEMVTLYSHRTGEFIDEIPAEKVKDLDNTHTGDSRYADFAIQYSENRKLIEKALGI